MATSRRSISFFSPINDKPATVATGPAPASPRSDFAPPPPRKTPRDVAELEHGDRDLRLMFDSPAFWADFSRRHDATGLFGNPYLTSPRGMLDFTEVSLAQAQALAQKILRDSTGMDGGALIRTLDRLSDTLCQVIDLMGCVRASHPDAAYQAAAQQSHETMFEFMNILNTSVELYDRLARVFGDPQAVARLTDEERATGRLLLADFEKSGIHLDPAARQQFIQLMNVISITGQEFMENASAPPTDPALAFVDAPLRSLAGMDPQLVAHLKRAQHQARGPIAKFFSGNADGPALEGSGSLLVPTTGWEAAAALRTVRDEAVRCEIWRKGRLAASDKEQDARLQTVLKARRDLAAIMGARSYAAYELQDKMVKRPELVVSFLETLEKTVRAKARGEIAALERLKQQATDIPNKSSAMEPWDRDFFGARFLNQQHLQRDHRDDTPSKAQVARLPEYFSLGTVMQGLSRLFAAMYGIRFVPVAPAAGETWRGDVRRVDVVSETEGLVGVMYCDLFQAPGKSPNPAHFTVRCSRRIFADEGDAVRALDPLAELRFARPEGGADEQQLPIIVLMCDFAPNSGPIAEDAATGAVSGRSLLTFSEVQTLFHEMGHAIHSMLGRTALHNVSGTRCATDFVELPSVLMERFAAAAPVLALYAHHHQTGEPLPYSLVAEHQRTAQQLLQHCETHSQIKLALLDQAFHNTADPALLATPDGLRDAYHALESRHAVFPADAMASTDDRWYTQFGHLVGYGASYYCYLLDRAIADRVWAHVFRRDPVARAAGEKWRTQVLRWGGSRDPWRMVAQVLDAPELAAGDEAAVELLARGFGVEEDVREVETEQ